MKIAVLAGGIGGARFLRGVRAARPDDEITAIVNTGDDVTMHGLRITPDLDSVMYTLGDAHDAERGWGRVGETWRIQEELKAYGAEPSWFSLGDLDIATHLVRTRMLDAGYPLTDVTAAIARRWDLGVTLLPMTDDRCETHVVVELDGARKAIHFQEWWVRYRCDPPAQAFVQVGVDAAKPTDQVATTLTQADVVLLAPSNPVVSIGTILGVPGLRDLLTESSAPIVGVSPIVGGAPVRGMADSCLPVIGVEVSAEGVGRHYGARSAGGLLDGWLVHDTDTADVPGVAVRSLPLMMTSDEASAAIVHAALDLV